MHKKHMWLQQAFEAVSSHTWIWNILRSMGSRGVLKYHIKVRQTEWRPCEKHQWSARLCQRRRLKHQIGTMIYTLKIPTLATQRPEGSFSCSCEFQHCHRPKCWSKGLHRPYLGQNHLLRSKVLDRLMDQRLKKHVVNIHTVCWHIKSS